jgi:hypothetical protein
MYSELCNAVVAQAFCTTSPYPNNTSTLVTSTTTVGSIATQALWYSKQQQGLTFKCADVGNGSVFTGVGNTNSGVSSANIDFAFQCRYDGQLFVYESGSVKVVRGTYTASDVLGVRVTATTVEYIKNDRVVYTSLQMPSFPLYVHVGDAAINEQAVYSESCNDAPVPTASSIARTGRRAQASCSAGQFLTFTSAPVTWAVESAVCVNAATEGYLQRDPLSSAEIVACGAISTQQIHQNVDPGVPQGVSFKFQPAPHCRTAVGLGNTSSNLATLTDIEFAWFVNSDYAYVYWSGTQIIDGNKDHRLRGITSSDVFEVRVIGISENWSTVQYLKNGDVIYTAPFNLHFHCTWIPHSSPWAAGSPR